MHKDKGNVLKRIVLFIWTMIAIGSLGFAGGDFKDVEPVVVPVIPIEEEDKSGLYAGLALAYNQTYSEDNGWFSKTKTQDQIGKLVGQVGYDFNEYVAVEGRIGGSVYDEDFASLMTYSLFLKPQYPISEDFTIYGLLGYGLVQIEGADGDEPGHADMVGEEMLDDSFFQWGFGLNYNINEVFSVFVDYTQLADDADISSTLYSYDPIVYDKLSNQDLTIGVIYNF